MISKNLTLIMDGRGGRQEDKSQFDFLYYFAKEENGKRRQLNESHFTHAQKRHKEVGEATGKKRKATMLVVETEARVPEPRMFFKSSAEGYALPPKTASK
ncbi:hypothetical protein Dimus_007028 [Dionaea muscipula]